MTKKEKVESVEMDDLLPDGSGVAPTHTRTPSPTPCDVLSQEGNFGQDLLDQIFLEVSIVLLVALSDIYQNILGSVKF